MNLLLITKDARLAKRMAFFIEKINPNYNVLETITTEQKMLKKQHSFQWFDLVLCDFDLLKEWNLEDFFRTKIEIPLVLISKSKKVAIQAFEYNCIDFLVKPVSEKRLSYTFQKLNGFMNLDSSQYLDRQLVESLVSSYEKKNYKKRFLIKIGARFAFVPTEKVSFFFSENGVTYLVEHGSSQKYIIDKTLNELQEKLLDPNKFYRVNRSTIINLDDVAGIKPYLNGRLVLSLNTRSEFDPIVARERVSDFKDWINQ